MEDTEKKKRKMIRTLNPNNYRMETKNSPEDWPGRCRVGQEESGYNSQSPLQVEPKQSSLRRWEPGLEPGTWDLGWDLVVPGALEALTPSTHVVGRGSVQHW